MSLKEMNQVQKESEKMCGSQQLDTLKLKADDQSKSSSTSVEYKEVDGTYFTLMKAKEVVKILMGSQVVSELIFENFEEAEKYIESKPYMLIAVMALVLAGSLINNKENGNK